jgi:hypothetical protein
MMTDVEQHWPRHAKVQNNAQKPRLRKQIANARRIERVTNILQATGFISTEGYAYFP